MNNYDFPTKKAGTVIEKRMERLRFRGELSSFLIKAAVFLLVAAIVYMFFFGIAVQHGEGMYPRVRDGDVMLYYRQPTSLKVGDIVVLKKNGVRYAGRIVAMPGDSIDFSEEGKVIINGAIQYEEIYYDTFAEETELSYPYKVPENSYFLLGDMRTGATDSRDFDAVSEKELEGKLIAILRRRGL